MPYKNPEDARRNNQRRYQHHKHRQGQATTRLGAHLEQFRTIAESRGLTVAGLLAQLAYAEIDRAGS